jgi:hypothetical protein
LHSLGKGRLTIKVEDDRLGHPKDKDTPMILIAVDIGIGPIMGLLEFQKYGEGPLIIICELRKKAEFITAVIWAFSEG